MFPYILMDQKISSFHYYSYRKVEALITNDLHIYNLQSNLI